MEESQEVEKLTHCEGVEEWVPLDFTAHVSDYWEGENYIVEIEFITDSVSSKVLNKILDWETARTALEARNASFNSVDVEDGIVRMNFCHYTKEENGVKKYIPADSFEKWERNEFADRMARDYSDFDRSVVRVSETLEEAVQSVRIPGFDDFQIDRFENQELGINGEEPLEPERELKLRRVTKQALEHENIRAENTSRTTYYSISNPVGNNLYMEKIDRPKLVAMLEYADTSDIIV